MGYFTTIINSYQHLMNLFPEPKMILAMKKTAPQADLGNSPSCLGTRILAQALLGHIYFWVPQPFQPVPIQVFVECALRTTDRHGIPPHQTFHHLRVSQRLGIGWPIA
jgi:hypothetical protein